MPPFPFGLEDGTLWLGSLGIDPALAAANGPFGSASTLVGGGSLGSSSNNIANVGSLIFPVP